MVGFRILVTLITACAAGTAAAEGCPFGVELKGCIGDELRAAAPATNNLGDHNRAYVPNQTSNDPVEFEPELRARVDARIDPGIRLQDLDDSEVERCLSKRVRRDPVEIYGEQLRLHEAELVGVYMRRDMRTPDNARFSGMLGYTMARFVNPADADNEGVGDLSYGVGATVPVERGLSLSVDYVRYVDRTEYEYNGVRLGLKSQF